MPVISNGRMNELLRAERDLEAMVCRENQKPFVDLMLHLVGVMLAATPYEEWPEMCKSALLHAGKDIPTGCMLYKQNLPKRSLNVLED